MTRIGQRCPVLNLKEYMHINRYIRKPEVRQIAGSSDSTIWRMEKRGQFPKRRQLGPNSVGWLLSEIEEWMESRPVVGETDQEGDQ